jgi:hypothetical protein
MWPLLMPWLGALALLIAAPTLAVLDAHAALVLAPLCALAAASATRMALAAATLNDQPTSARRWVQRARWAALIVVLPAAQLALHGVFLPWCAPVAGLQQWLLAPTLAAVVAVCMAVVAAVIWPRHPRTGWLIIAMITTIPPVWRFLTEPTVASWHVLLGFVPGAVYEDAFGPDHRLVAFRAITTAGWLALAAAAAVALEGRANGSAIGVGQAVHRVATDGRGRVAVVVAATAAAVAVLLGADQGWRVTRADVLATLPITVELDVEGDSSPEAIVHLAATPGWRQRAARIGEDTALQWLALRAFFGVKPERPIEVFVYADDRQKSALMGADAVEMAKPWLSEAHLVDPGYGASILSHEMAHVFGASLAGGIFGVPMHHGVLPDALRIEGLAVAAEWPIRGGLDPHGMSRAMRILNLAPPIATLLTPAGFAGQNAAVAYTLAGSWVRLIAARCGRGGLARYYDGADVDVACGAAPGAMATAWERFVDSDQAGSPSDDALALARASFESPGLLARPCLLETGRCAHRASEAWRRGDAEAERGIWHDLRAALTPHLGQSQLPLGLDLAWTAALVRTGDLAAAAAVIEGRIASAPRALDRAALLDARGDLALLQGDSQAARAAWGEALKLPAGAGTQRTLLAKAALVGSKAGRDAVALLFALGRPSVDVDAVVRHLLAAAPHEPWARYLAARRRLFQDTESEDASERAHDAAALHAITRDPRMPAQLRVECGRLLALLAARDGRCDAVERYADEAGGDATVVAWRTQFLSRCNDLRELQRSGRTWLRLKTRPIQ